jgi:2-dehydro-3-deoxy-D-gluconate 5-dehydrogenase
MKQYKDVTFDFSGKVVLITGAASGIFQSVAIAFGEAGAKVAMTNNRNTAGCEETKRRIEEAGGEAKIYKCNAAEVTQIETTVAAVLEDFGKVDIMINGAGVNFRAKSEEFPTDKWQFVMDVDCNAVFYFCREVGRSMIDRGEGGKIVNCSSLLAFNGGFTVPAYAAAKGAVTQFTKAICNEWASKKINVNAIAPGYVLTDMTQPLKDDPVRGPSISARIPAGHWGDPKDMVGICMFLSSEAADYIHGVTIPVDGGWMAR